MFSDTPNLKGERIVILVQNLLKKFKPSEIDPTISSKVKDLPEFKDTFSSNESLIRSIIANLEK